MTTENICPFCGQMDEQKKRLIELLENSEGAVYWNSSDKNFIEKIADYLLANGVIVPPCKVGDTVYYIGGRYYCISGEQLYKRCKKCGKVKKWIYREFEGNGYR